MNAIETAGTQVADDIAAPDAQPKQKINWQKIMMQYRKPTVLQSSWQLINTLVPYFAFVVVAYLLLDVSYWLTLLACIPAALFLVRTFIIAHDCGHGSFFKSRRANDFWGSFTSILCFVPYYAWKHEHAIHHATSSNLDMRGMGDIEMLTVAEYKAASPWKRFTYRLYRHPITMFGIGPVFVFLINYRGWPKGSDRRVKLSVIRNNIAIAAIIAVASLTVGFQAYVLVQLPIIMLAGSMGIWMFYVHHQYEGVIWKRSEDWTYFDQALEGSSYYKLPKIMHWLTGNIGYHHVHHLDSRIPNYCLRQCHEEVEFLGKVPPITFWKSLAYAHYRLWDEENQRMVTFGELAREARQ